MRKSWTDEESKMVARLWDKGWSAREIAVKIGGVSRSAVIGKVRRMNLPLRNQKKPVRVVGSKPVKAKRPRVFVSASPSPAPGAEPSGIALLGLGANQCRWPIGDPKSSEFGYCGCRTRRGQSYCEEHRERARWG